MRKSIMYCRCFKIIKRRCVKEIPQDENGRFLDKPTRAMIHEALIRRISK